MVICYVGSGPGADEGFAFQAIDLTTERQRSYRSPAEGASFFRPIDGQRLVAVKGFGEKRQEIVILNTQSDAVDTIAYTTSGAVMFPTVSPDGSLLAALFLPDRRDAPPRGACQAQLGVMALARATGGGRPTEIAAIDVLVHDIPAIPVDWASDGSGLFYTIVDPPRIAYVDLRTRRTSVLRPGLFPCVSRNSEMLALIDDHDVVVVRQDDVSVELVSTTLAGQPAWLAWQPDDVVLAYAEELPAWRVRIGLVTVGGKVKSPLLETARAKDLGWLSEMPQWKSYQVR